MKKLLLLTLLSFGLPAVADDSVQDKTEALHAEAKERKNPNITEKTHPVLYGMVKDLINKAKISMPKYITLHDAEGSAVDENGQVHKTANNITVWVDMLGDLYICREIVTDLSYEEAQGVIAVAIAEKAQNKSIKLGVVGVGTFAATAALMYYACKDNNIISRFVFGNDVCCRDRENRMKLLFYSMLIPSFLTTAAVSNNLQKQVDLDAVALTDADQIIGGIKGLARLEETYVKENVFSRMANALNLKSIFNTIFYPVRSFTQEERLQYLEQLKA